MKSYQPLARKYRPGTFQDLVGQESTAIALANAIRLGREPHAIIFSGVRGVGKTTSARLYAKALNCDQGTSPEPCDRCESCKAIDIGNHEDVLEVDGASNTSVDNIRNLRETISYVTQRSRFKIYIIDEVHMLSQSAFNALLKTLEEPPPHVVFVFATTELQKIPQTILSRCQVFYLQRLTQQTILGRLLHVLTQENLEYEQEAVAAVAREGHGSMRDALTLLDHVIAIGDGRVTIAALSKIVSHVTLTPFLDLLEALVVKNQMRVAQLISTLDQTGVEMKVVAERVAGLARHAFVARDVGVDFLQFKSLGFGSEEERRLVDIAKSTAPFDLNRLFRTLVKSLDELDGSPLDRFILENYCLEWCLDPGFVTLQKLYANEQPAPQRPAPVARPQVVEAVCEAKVTEAKVADAIVAPKQQVSSERKLPGSWRELVQIWMKEKPLQARKLEEVHVVQYGPDKIELVISEGSYVSSSLMRPEEQRKLKEAFAELFAFNGLLQIRTRPGAEKSGASSTVEGLQETLATEKEREAQQRRIKIESDARNHPLTKDAIALFDATIEKVTVLES